MSRTLVALNTLLVLGSLAAVGVIVREVRVKPVPVVVRPTLPSAPPPAVAVPAPPPAGAYSVIASRNLFSPTRSEGLAPATVAAAALPKPFLFGILLREGAPVAYLEDPTTKRVAGYRLGDSIAGGTVTQITADQVVLNRPDGDINVRLHDPAKPRPAPVATPAPPGAAVLPGLRGAPGLVPPGAAQPQPGLPGLPGVQVPGLPGSAATQPGLPRRPLPSNLLRRMPAPVPAPDATTGR